mmetsp:Transcript_28180/g.71850  ORF Transcript_28180/g.71850 Transcript_28180/m.71850 type:complete len:347 (-) Transcript_28180:123-1163(-)
MCYSCIFRCGLCALCNDNLCGGEGQRLWRLGDELTLSAVDVKRDGGTRYVLIPLIWNADTGGDIRVERHPCSLTTRIARVLAADADAVMNEQYTFRVNSGNAKVPIYFPKGVRRRLNDGAAHVVRVVPSYQLRPRATLLPPPMQRGWCFVRLPPAICEWSQSMRSDISRFKTLTTAQSTELFLAWWRRSQPESHSLSAVSSSSSSFVTLSLLCPVLFTRMRLPGCTRYCTHPQRFDLQMFVKLLDEPPTRWKCPICMHPVHAWSDLLVDEKWVSILQHPRVQRNQQIEEIAMDAQGTWSVTDAKEEETEEEEGEDKKKKIEEDNEDDDLPLTEWTTLQALQSLRSL